MFLINPLKTISLNHTHHIMPGNYKIISQLQETHLHS